MVQHFPVQWWMCFWSLRICIHIWAMIYSVTACHVWVMCMCFIWFNTSWLNAHSFFWFLCTWCNISPCIFACLGQLFPVYTCFCSVVSDVRHRTWFRWDIMKCTVVMMRYVYFELVSIPSSLITFVFPSFWVGVVFPRARLIWIFYIVCVVAHAGDGILLSVTLWSFQQCVSWTRTDMCCDGYVYFHSFWVYVTFTRACFYVLSLMLHPLITLLLH